MRSPPPRHRLSGVQNPRYSRKQLVRVGAVALLVLGVFLWWPQRDNIDLTRLPRPTLSSTRWHSSEPQRSQQQEGVQDVWVDIESEMRWTKLAGGTGGYTVWSDLYLSGGILIPVVEDKEDIKAFPERKKILSGPKDKHGGHPGAGEDRWTEFVGREIALSELGKSVVRLPGITYIFNDPPGPEGYLAYFSHFISEVFPPAVRSAASAISAPMDLPTRIIFPRCGPKPSWRDDRGWNQWLLMRMLPGTVIEDKTAWDDRTASGISYIFDTVVIVDRWGAHSQGGPAMQRWGKMHVNTPALNAPGDFFAPYVENLRRSFDPAIMADVGKYNLPVVVYMQKEGNGAVSPDSEKQITNMLEKFIDRAEVHVSKVRAMTREQKIMLMSKSDVVISVNDEEMLHATWMPHGGTVIELIEAGGFNPDYWLAGGIMNHTHVIIQHNRVLGEEDMLEAKRIRGPQEKTGIDIDARLVEKVLEETLSDMRLRARK